MISLRNVNKVFGKRYAVRNFTCELQPGCYGLLGANGAGKTTLLRCILGLHTVTDGEIIREKKEKIGYLPQKFGMFRELKVKDMMYYFAVAKEIPKKERDTEIERVLELVNLSQRKDEKVGNLSGGMQRRLGIAQAVLGNPDVVFLDEPTTGLDPEERARFKDMICRLKKENRIILISTHIVEDVESVCDRVLIMKEGSLLENVTVKEACNFAETGNPTLELGYLARLK